MPGAARALPCPACFLPSRPGAGAGSAPTQGRQGNLALGRVGSTMAPQCRGRTPRPAHPCPRSSALPSVRRLGRRSLPVEACLRSSPICLGRVPDPGLAREHRARGCWQRCPHPGRGAGPGRPRGRALPLPRCHQSRCHPCWEGCRLCKVPTGGRERTSAALPMQPGCSKPWGDADPLCPPATGWACGAARAVHRLPRPVLHPCHLGGTLACRSRSMCRSPQGCRCPRQPRCPCPSWGRVAAAGLGQPSPAHAWRDQAPFGTELHPVTRLASGSGLLSPGAARGRAMLGSWGQEGKSTQIGRASCRERV